MTDIRLQTCPICGRPSVAKTRPFCSVRCADVDLGRWLTGSYAIPVPDDEADTDDGEAEFQPRSNVPGHGGTP